MLRDIIVIILNGLSAPRRWYVGWTAAGFVTVNGRQVTAHSAWGTRRELFRRWREDDLSYTMRQMQRMELTNGEADPTWSPD